MLQNKKRKTSESFFRDLVYISVRQSVIGWGGQTFSWCSLQKVGSYISFPFSLANNTSNLLSSVSMRQVDISFNTQGLGNFPLTGQYLETLSNLWWKNKEGFSWDKHYLESQRIENDSNPWSSTTWKDTTHKKVAVIIKRYWW